MSSHTPGPWIAVSGTDGSLRRFEVRSELTAESITGWGCVRQTEANARLIAAAPELLAACKAMRRTMYSPESEESILADAAIAKAEGRTDAN